MTNEIGPLRIGVDEWPELSDHVAVIFGGITRSGDRRARRNVRAAVEDGCDVIWFDGWEGREDSPDGSRRQPLDSALDGTVVIIGYREMERNLVVNRLPQMNRRIDKGVKSLPIGNSRPVRRALALFDSAFTSSVRPWLKFVSSVFRGWFAWRRLSAVVAEVARRQPVVLSLVYVDDYSLPLAWNAAHHWPDCRTGGSYEPQAKLRSER